MRTLDTKQNILDDAGFIYNFDRQVYFHRKDKKVFSVEFVQDSDEDKLERLIREDNFGSGWMFYFNSEPSDWVRQEIEAELERG